MKFTDLSLRALTVKTGQRIFFDDALPGFGLRVSPRSKSFVVVRRRDNSARWETLGRYPEALSLSDARRLARITLLSVAPIMAPLTFEQALQQYRERHLTRIRPGTAFEQNRILTVRFLPTLGRIRLDRLTSRDIAPIIDAIPNIPSARAAFVAIRTFLNWCVKRDYLHTSPIIRLDCPKRPAARARVLSDDELAHVWRCAPDTGYGDVVKLLILTGQRRGQIAALKPEFLISDNITWPPALMKANRQHSIPLTPMTAGILARYPQGMPSVQHWSWFKLKLDRASGLTDWVLHDLRRTFATRLAEIGTAPHIIERIIAHAGGTISGVAAIYNRFSYQAEMREALLRWENHLQALLPTTESLDV